MTHRIVIDHPTVSRMYYSGKYDSSCNIVHFTYNKSKAKKFSSKEEAENFRNGILDDMIKNSWHPSSIVIEEN